MNGGAAERTTPDPDTPQVSATTLVLVLVARLFIGLVTTYIVFQP